jgi:hypothetical protein
LSVIALIESGSGIAVTRACGSNSRRFKSCSGVLAGAGE